MSAQTETPWRDEERLRELYWDEGLCAREIAERLGCTERTIWTWIKKHDMETRRMGHPRVEHVWFDPCREGYERWKDTHPPAKHEVVYVHTLLAIAEYGFEAVAEGHIHHKNNIPWDNRPENVEVLGAGEHLEKHHEEDWDFQGEGNPNAKLTEPEVAEIKRRRDESADELAEEFSIAPGTVNNIWAGRAWRHVEPADLEETNEA